ncbi:MAG: PAS domain S-box protein, partial [Nitrospirota bacterium]
MKTRNAKARLKAPKTVKCWEYFGCGKTECPVFKSRDHRCWLYSGTCCRDHIQGKFLEKMEMCLDCVPFKSNIKHTSLRDTLRVINSQFKQYKRVVTRTDDELRSISMELAISLSEVFEALRKISSGENNINLVEKSNFELISMLKHVVNLTAREIRRAEETMRFTQFAIDHTADAAFWMTSDGRIVYVNKEACRSLGYTREELLRMTIHDVDFLFPKRLWEDRWKHIKEKKTFSFESIHKARDGRIFPVEVTVNYVAFKGKEYDCAFARDITKRKSMLEQLRESEQKYRELFFIETDAIVIFEEGNFRFIDVNESAAQIYGYDRDEFLSMTRPDISAEPARSREWIRKVLSGDTIW